MSRFVLCLFSSSLFSYFVLSFHANRVYLRLSFAPFVLRWSCRMYCYSLMFCALSCPGPEALISMTAAGSFCLYHSSLFICPQIFFSDIPVFGYLRSQSLYHGLDFLGLSSFAVGWMDLLYCTTNKTHTDGVSSRPFLLFFSPLLQPSSHLYLSIVLSGSTYISNTNSTPLWISPLRHISTRNQTVTGSVVLNNFKVIRQLPLLHSAPSFGKSRVAPLPVLMSGPEENTEKRAR